MTLCIQQLRKDHDRKNFDCGVPELNDFLRKTARQNNERDLIRVFVLVEEERPTEILGYYTLSLKELQDTPDHSLFKSYPHPLPVALLARLAVSVTCQGRGYGEMLLTHAIVGTVEVADRGGLVGLVVDPKEPRAQRFYEHMDFNRMSETSSRLWLPIQDCRRVILGE